MPILDLQRRMRQLGEIRIGHAVDTGRTSKKTGQPIRRPEKLASFRVTSASSALLEPVAQLYGGTVQQYTPANNGPDEWEVYTQTDRLPVIVPPANAVTQWYEQYKGGLCIRRCDGRTEQKQDTACLCDPEARDCQITTRLNVMLRDVPGMGVWLLTSRGYYAAVELPDVAEFLSMTRGYVNGWLTMEEKVIPRESGPASRFMVPKLDVDVSPGQLMSGQGATGAAAVSGQEGPAVGAGDAPELESGEAEGPLRPWLERLANAKTSNEVRALYKEANAAGVMSQTLSETMRATADALDLAAKQQAEEPAEVQAEAAEPVVVDAVPDEAVDGEVDTAWMALVSVWTGSMEELADAYARTHGGELPDGATAAELEAFTVEVKAGRVSPAATGTSVEEVPY